MTASKTALDDGLSRRVLAGFVLTSALSACAIGRSEMVIHSFSFDVVVDSPDSEVLAYRYGDGKTIMTSSDVAIRQFGKAHQATHINGAMPVGDSLYVKWRSKRTGEVFEDTVDLKSRLPKQMLDQRVYFVVQGKTLFVYLTDLNTFRPKHLPIVGPFKTQPYLTVQIYPNP